MKPEELRGSSLKTKRLEAMLTQAELAKLIGVTKLSVLRWEVNAKQPSLRHMRAMTQIFNTLERLENTK